MGKIETVHYPPVMAPSIVYKDRKRHIWLDEAKQWWSVCDICGCNIKLDGNTRLFAIEDLECRTCAEKAGNCPICNKSHEPKDV